MLPCSDVPANEGDGVLAVDASSLAVTPVATGLGSPTTVVYANGSLWTTDGNTTLEQVDSGTGVVTPHTGILDLPSDLIGDPADTDVIFSYDEGDSPETINRIDVTGTPTVASSVLEGNIDNVDDIAVAPDGGRRAR